MAIIYSYTYMLSEIGLFLLLFFNGDIHFFLNSDKNIFFVFGVYHLQDLNFLKIYRPVFKQFN